MRNLSELAAFGWHPHHFESTWILATAVNRLAVARPDGRLKSVIAFVRRRGTPPTRSRYDRYRRPSKLASKAIHRPSGDQLARRRWRRAWVIWRDELPSIALNPDIRAMWLRQFKCNLLSIGRNRNRLASGRPPQLRALRGNRKSQPPYSSVVALAGTQHRSGPFALVTEASQGTLLASDLSGRDSPIAAPAHFHRKPVRIARKKGIWPGASTG